MNHITKVALCGLMAASAFTSTTYAEDIGVKPYIGLDYNRISADYQTFNGVDQSEVLADSFNGFNPYIGFQLTERFGVELGYIRTGTQDKSFDSAVIGLAPGTTINTSTKISGFHADAVGRHAVSDKLDLLGSVGLARLKADITASVANVSISDSESDTALRAGVGARYAVTDELGLRGMVRYMKVDFDDTADGAFQYSFGVNYRF